MFFLIQVPCSVWFPSIFFPLSFPFSTSSSFWRFHHSFLFPSFTSVSSFSLHKLLFSEGMPQQRFQFCLSSCTPPHTLVTANCAPFLDWHCFPRGRTAVMIGGSNVLTIFSEHKHCHSVWKATLIEHRFVQAAHWMDFPWAWLVLQLILAIDWIPTIVIPPASGRRTPLALRAEDVACTAQRLQQSWTPTTGC